MRFFVTASPGLEDLLLDELKSLVPQVQKQHDVLVFEGEWEDALKVVVYSRLASRVLWNLRSFSAKNTAMLYDQVRRIDWPKLIPLRNTFGVYASGKIDPECDFKLSFAPLKIKDAICDEYRKRTNSDNRPNVSRQEPDVRVEAHFHQGRCELSVDIVGFPLFQRQYRTEASLAPLKETRAAALLRFAGYQPGEAVLDPFCGAGTILIEAALMQKNIAPGLLRESRELAAFLMDTENKKRFEVLLKEAKAQVKPIEKSTQKNMEGWDLISTVSLKARSNAERAGVLDVLHFQERDALSVENFKGLIVCNPPFGERLSDEERAAELLSQFARQLKHKSPGCRLAILVPAGRMEKSFGFKPSRSLALKAGDLSLKFLLFEIREGKFHRGAAPAPL